MQIVSKTFYVLTLYPYIEMDLGCFLPLRWKVCRPSAPDNFCLYGYTVQPRLTELGNDCPPFISVNQGCTVICILDTVLSKHILIEMQQNALLLSLCSHLECPTVEYICGWIDLWLSWCLWEIEILLQIQLVL